MNPLTQKIAQAQFEKKSKRSFRFSFSQYPGESVYTTEMTKNIALNYPNAAKSVFSQNHKNKSPPL